jgi:hypothetical protein
MKAYVVTSDRWTDNVVPEAPLPPSSGGSPLQLLAKACASSGCPTIYQSDKGTLIVQGYALSADQTGLDVPDGELLVEIPIDLLAAAARNIQ